MDAADIQRNVEELFRQPCCQESFIKGFLRAYNIPKSALSRHRCYGDLPKEPLDFFKKQKVYFRGHTDGSMHAVLEDMAHDPRVQQYKVRFVILTDFKILLAKDLVVQDPLRITFDRLPQYYDFFLPLAGFEKESIVVESGVDRRAAYQIGELYQQVRKDNPDLLDADHDKVQDLNRFLCRLIFCFFAEDTGLFRPNQFTENVLSHTRSDGFDLKKHLTKIFKRLNQKRVPSGCSASLKAFPYVNGDLFGEDIEIPKLSRRARVLQEFGALDWKSINPDIFGAMIQAVHTTDREDLGCHYTSPENIHRLIGPLFLEDLKREFAAAQGQPKALQALLQRIYRLRILDPCCGSGNFLIITFKALRTLEKDIFSALGWQGDQIRSGVRLNQFYGIEIQHFPAELAKLSLYLAEHQMNVELREAFGLSADKALPLGTGGHIICDNALRCDWLEFIELKKEDKTEIYIVGNPPYSGFSKMSESQKQDMKRLTHNLPGRLGRLDYVSGWFIKAAKCFAHHPIQGAFAFVATNSICQGNHVELLWPILHRAGLEIHFAYRTFVWSNNAVGQAGVMCVIVVMQHTKKLRKSRKRFLFTPDPYGGPSVRKEVPHINAYLRAGAEVIVDKESISLSSLPTMTCGSQLTDGGHLILNLQEKNALLKAHPSSSAWIHGYASGGDLLDGRLRYVLRIPEADLQAAQRIPEIQKRLTLVSEFRRASKKAATHKLAVFPYKFDGDRYQHQPCFAVPQVSSARRRYLPVAHVPVGTVVSEQCYVVYLSSNEENFVFSVLSSRMHRLWANVFGGRMGVSVRYSASICYNAFPFPQISEQVQGELEHITLEIFAERERHPYKTLAELYDPDKMPLSLLGLHRKNDRLVEERCYGRAFGHDDERLDHLIALYQKMKNAKGTDQGGKKVRDIARAAGRKRAVELAKGLEAEREIRCMGDTRKEHERTTKRSA